MTTDGPTSKALVTEGIADSLIVPSAYIHIQQKQHYKSTSTHIWIYETNAKGE